MIKKCPFCKTECDSNIHIYHCSRSPHGVQKSEVRYLYLIYNFPMLTKDVVTEEYVNKNRSLPDIKREYKIDYKAFLFLLNYYSITRRSSSESAKTITAVKSKETCLKKYGVESTFSKGGVSYHKRLDILKKKYGVGNSFQIPSVIQKINDDKNWIKKYGITRKQKRSEEGRNYWKGLTEEEKIKWLEKSLWSVKCRTFGSRQTSLEKKIADIFMQNKIPYEYQFVLRISNKRRYFYDFYLADLGVIIETNGSYWHANPSIYKPTDVLKNMRCVGEITAQEIWDMDKKKEDLARNSGYAVVVIWDHEISNNITNSKQFEFKNDNEIREILFSKIKDAINESKGCQG